MSERQDVDEVLQDWPYKPGVISARLVPAADGREVMQMRIEMGLLQMEISGRPDGEKPHGAETCLDWLIGEALVAGDEFALTEDQSFEIDREFLQYYHRRICFLALRKFDVAVSDADHTLELMDFVATHSPDPEWTDMHERYRPFVLFHRAQAAAMDVLEKAGPTEAIEQIDDGLKKIRKVFEDRDTPEEFDDDELVGQLVELKKSLRDRFEVGSTLGEQLADAVAAEEYERAAKLRDQIAKRDGPA
ncbi:MAG: UvrB/UvrC motif-containing protein [Thermoguttaceae bacterium]